MLSLDTLAFAVLALIVGLAAGHHWGWHSAMGYFAQGMSNLTRSVTNHPPEED